MILFEHNKDHATVTYENFAPVPDWLELRNESRSSSISSLTEKSSEYLSPRLSSSSSAPWVIPELSILKEKIQNNFR